MERTLPLLDQVRIASPCQASWDDMAGDDRRRFCKQCSLHVYDLSDMPRDEAERFVSQAEGRTCVRFFQRADGTVLTRDCPVGLRGVRQRLVRAVAALAGMLLALATGSVLAGWSKGRADAIRCEESMFSRWIQPEQRLPPMLGKMLAPIPLRPPAPTPPPPNPGQ